MYVLKMDGSKELITTVRQSVYQGEKNADTLIILVPKLYDNFDMTTGSGTLQYMLPDTDAYVDLELTPTEHNAEYMAYTTPLGAPITSATGIVLMRLQIKDADGNVILVSGNASLPILCRDGTIPDVSAQDKDKLARLAEQVGLLKQVKADSITYDAERRKLQLIANGSEVGQAVTIPPDESDIFWVTTNLPFEPIEGEVPIDKTAEEIIGAYKSGKTIFWNVILTAKDEEDEERTSSYGVTLKQSQVLDSLNGAGCIYFFFHAASFDLDGGYNALGSFIVIDLNDNKMSAYMSSESDSVGILTEDLPVESNLNGAARKEEYALDTHAAYYDHVHPAPFPNWTNSIGKALFVNNDNTTPSKAFEWRDVPNGTFISKVGDVLRVAAVDEKGQPTQWKTDSLVNAEGESF